MIIPAMSIRTCWFGNGDWYSFLVWSPSWHVAVLRQLQTKKRIYWISPDTPRNSTTVTTLLNRLATAQQLLLLLSERETKVPYFYPVHCSGYETTCYNLTKFFFKKQLWFWFLNFTSVIDHTPFQYKYSPLVTKIDFSLNISYWFYNLTSILYGAIHKWCPMFLPTSSPTYLPLSNFVLL